MIRRSRSLRGARARAPPPGAPTQLIGREPRAHRAAGASSSAKRSGWSRWSAPAEAARRSSRSPLAADAAASLPTALRSSSWERSRDPALCRCPQSRRRSASSEQPGEPLEQTIAKAIADRELLVVLDNFEQVIDAGPLLLDLLGGAPQLTLVVTSRRVLHLSGEQVFTVQPLAEADAVTLFLARAGAGDAAARVARRRPRRDRGDLPAPRRSAARDRACGGAGTSAHAAPAPRTPRASITVLAAGPRDLPARQQTLRDTLAWSFALLTPDEQMSSPTCRCSPAAARSTPRRTSRTPISTGWQRSSTTACFGASTPATSRDSRCSKPSANTRAEQLAEERLARERTHASYFADLAETAELRGPEQQHWLELLDRERDNLRAALDHAAGCRRSRARAAARRRHSGGSGGCAASSPRAARVSSTRSRERAERRPSSSPRRTQAQPESRGVRATRTRPGASPSRACARLRAPTVSRRFRARRSSACWRGTTATSSRREHHLQASARDRRTARPGIRRLRREDEPRLRCVRIGRLRLGRRALAGGARLPPRRETPRGNRDRAAQPRACRLSARG